MALSGKIALVTGASQGLGKGFSDVLLKNGAKVALLDVNETAGKNAKADFDKEYGEDSTIFLTCDVTSYEHLKDAFQKTIEKFGRIDIVSNNAGIVDETNWEKTVEVNLNGVIRGTYLALQHMKKGSGGGGEGGVIINTSSMAGLGPLLTSPVYTASKHGVVGFTRAMAEASSVSGYGVRINAFCPSFVKTPILDFMTNEKAAGQLGHLQHLSDKILAKTGILEVPAVAERFLQLVTDEEKNGAVMMVTQECTAYMNFPKDFKDAPKTILP
ncbi:15-hydroxyprostaglandin dehydrogenase [NAD(+)]-like isoform X1 [Anguilla rostrata]|uniref:15-hydroxyprostaglandin dehydrogenase [NAD(+)]-like isoform X1 n=1 Tax=Anguilla rostrata TaxID=7938 RepID=UPI0030D08713